MSANALKIETTKGLSQFELTTNLLNNLSQFKLTPVAKLVLLELSTHFNNEKNGAVVYPSIDSISKKLGVGLSATKQAIKDLITEGLIIKSKMSNVHGNFNKYCLTLKVQNLTSKQPKNELSKRSDSELFLLRTDKHEHINNKPKDNKVGGNVYLTEEDKILYEYAKPRAKKSVDAYVRFLKSNGSDKQIIKDYRAIQNRNKAQEQKMQEILKHYKEIRETAEPPCEAWIKLGEKIKMMKNKNPFVRVDEN